MPARRSLGASAVAGPSVPVPAPVHVHPITKRLRKMWKFAAICQFLFVFDEAFGMSGFESETLEADFESSETAVIPDLAKRLLYTLTLDRSIDTTNWQEHVRAQYLFRDPEANKYGTLEAPIHWAQLSLEDKISTLHDLCEWQLQDPERFRRLVKNEEEVTAWRVAPIGWDSQDNAYWLFDDNRIWIQRPEPLPAAPSKSKAPPKKGSKRARTEAAAARRAAKAAESTGAGQKRSRASDNTPTSTPSKRTRTSLGGPSSNGKTNTPSRPPPRRGTRTSARFAPQADQGDEDEEDEQEANRNGDHGLDDSSSELSDPPENMSEPEPTAEEPNVKMEDAQTAIQQDDQESNNPQEEEEEENAWVEFEAIVISRQEWLDFAKRFARSKDPNEKNLHQFINEEVLDKVIAAMDEIDRQKALEQAMANRKRSSRIAVKELEKEERERDREARARMEEKMAAIRKDEEQKRRKEEEELEAQQARENRIREREERIRAREIELETKAIREEEERERREKEREERKRRREEIIANGGVPPPSKESTPVPESGSGDVPDGAYAEAQMEEEEDWELNCEVCGKAAINPPNEDKEIVACEDCGVWQHVRCWNKFDKHIVGRKKNRNWAQVDFFCTKCRPPADGVPRPTPGMVFKREKSSPSASSIGRSSQDPESPVRKASEFSSSAPLTNGSPRHKIKLTFAARDANNEVQEQRNQQLVPQQAPPPIQPPTVPSQHLAQANSNFPGVSSTALPPTPVLASAPAPTPATTSSVAGPKPAETGVLVSSGALNANALASAPVSLPPPSTRPINSAAPDMATIGQPVLPPRDNGITAAPLHRDVPALPAAKPSPSAMQPPQAAAARGLPSPSPAVSSSGSESGLGFGRPTQSPFSTLGSPRSPSSGTANLPNPMAHQPRSPSYNGGLSSPAFRRPSQASGSFPMRHTPARSPLSRPNDSAFDHAEPSSGFSLGPARAVSPSTNRGPLNSFTGAAKALQVQSPAPIATTDPVKKQGQSDVLQKPVGTAAPSPTRLTDSAPSSLPADHPAATRPFASLGAVAGTAFSQVGTSTPLPASDHKLSSTGHSNGFQHKSPKMTSTSAASGGVVPTASLPAAAAAFRTLEHGLDDLPHLFTDPTHRHLESPPIRRPSLTEKPVELPPAHVSSPEFRAQSGRSKQS